MQQKIVRGPLYFIAFTDWNGNATEFTQSVFQLIDDTSAGPTPFVPVFERLEWAEAALNKANEHLEGSPAKFSVHLVQYPYDVLKVFEHLQQRYFEVVNFNLERENGAYTVYRIDELHRAILEAI